ncbi:thiamine pyrophosphate-dependent enzyme, partial [Salmonella enterica subsp. enterica serovar Anatum]|nr:thiamine pyrophosphate-dependent enzyme [Salmonella enterica subsp. enterica serovar Anatum]
ALPKEMVVCVTGDGSIQMNIQELSTALQYELPVLVLNLNNRYDHYYNVLKSDLGKRILASSESKGFVGLTWYDGGARSFYAGKP